MFNFPCPVTFYQQLAKLSKLQFAKLARFFETQCSSTKLVTCTISCRVCTAVMVNCVVDY